VPFLSALEVVYDDALYKLMFTLLYFTTVNCCPFMNNKCIYSIASVNEIVISSH